MWWSTEEEVPEEGSSEQKGLAGTEFKSFGENQRIDKNQWAQAWSNVLLEQMNQESGTKAKDGCSESKWSVCVNAAEEEHSASKKGVMLVVRFPCLLLVTTKQP